MTSDERFSQIAGPFVRLETIIRSRCKMPHYDIFSIFALFMTLAGVSLFLINGVVASIVSILGGTGLIFFLATDVKRYVRRKGLPLLVKELKGLETKSGEVTEIFNILRHQKYKVVQYFDVNEVMRCIE
jgi:hypothetical protein